MQTSTGTLFGTTHTVHHQFEQSHAVPVTHRIMLCCKEKIKINHHQWIIMVISIPKVVFLILPNSEGEFAEHHFCLVNLVLAQESDVFAWKSHSKQTLFHSQRGLMRNPILQHFIAEQNVIKWVKNKWSFKKTRQYRWRFSAWWQFQLCVAWLAKVLNDTLSVHFMIHQNEEPSTVPECAFWERLIRADSRVVGNEIFQQNEVCLECDLLSVSPSKTIWWYMDASKQSNVLDRWSLCCEACLRWFRSVSARFNHVVHYNHYSQYHDRYWCGRPTMRYIYQHESLLKKWQQIKLINIINNIGTDAPSNWNTHVLQLS